MFLNSLDSASLFQKDSSNQKKNYFLIPYLLISNKNIKIDSNHEQLKWFTEIINLGLVYIFGYLQ